MKFLLFTKTILISKRQIFVIVIYEGTFLNNFEAEYDLKGPCENQENLPEDHSNYKYHVPWNTLSTIFLHN